MSEVATEQVNAMKRHVHKTRENAARSESQEEHASLRRRYVTALAAINRLTETEAGELQRSAAAKAG